jgi:hypothetical protein
VPNNAVCQDPEERARRRLLNFRAQQTGPASRSARFSSVTIRAVVVEQFSACGCFAFAAIEWIPLRPGRFGYFLERRVRVAPLVSQDWEGKHVEEKESHQADSGEPS